MRRRAFALLEVIISLAILVVALAALGELLRNGLRSATAARDLSRATMLAETKLAQITSGLVAPDPVSNAAFENEPGWLYSIDVTEGGTPQLLAIRVNVMRDVPEKQQTVSCSLVRWVINPSAETTAMDSLQDSSSSSSSSSSTGSSTGSGAGGAP
jgi:prepilin-type N-terminal cleavage/methylation domain-containing protein